MCSQHVCGQIFSFAKSCLLALPNCSTDLVCGGFFSGMFQKSHPNFQDVKRVDLLESQNGRVRGEAWGTCLRTPPPNPQTAQTASIHHEAKETPKAGESQHFSSILEVIFLRNTKNMGFKFQESLFWVVRPPIYLKHEVSTGWRQWSVGDHRKLVRKVNFKAAWQLFAGLCYRRGWQLTWDMGSWKVWKMKVGNSFFGATERSLKDIASHVIQHA